MDELIPDVYGRLFAPGDAWAARQPNRENKPIDATPDPALADFPSLRDLYMAAAIEENAGCAPLGSAAHPPQRRVCR